jgi:hypothetical protein
MRRTANAADQFSTLRNKPDVHLDLKLFGFQPFNAEPNDLSFRAKRGICFFVVFPQPL